MTCVLLSAPPPWAELGRPGSRQPMLPERARPEAARVLAARRPWHCLGRVSLIVSAGPRVAAAAAHDLPQLGDPGSLVRSAAFLLCRTASPGRTGGVPMTRPGPATAGGPGPSQP